MKPQLIVALDIPDVERIGPLVDSLPADILHYKVGLELYTAEGPAALHTLQMRHKLVFLDLKLHDIPRTVAHAVQVAARLRVSLLTIHAAGGRTMLKMAADTMREMGPDAPRLLAVTALTSLDERDLHDMGIERDMPSHVLAMADLALSCGIPGLVCSPLEVQPLRERFGPDPILVVPGIRPLGSQTADQKRVGTAADVARNGASYLVVGRPILEANNPPAAAQGLLDEIRDATARR